MNFFKKICEKISLILVLLFTVKVETFQMPLREYQDGFTICSTTENFPLFFELINATQFQEIEQEQIQYFCDLGDDPNCDSWWVSNDWKIANSIENEMANILNDERWEELKVPQLEDKYPNGTLKYTKLLSLDKETVVPIYWSISKDAKIYFCSGENLIYSYCIKMTFLEGVRLQKAGVIRGEPKSFLNETNWADGKWRSFQWLFEFGKVHFTKYHEKGQEIDYPYPGLALRHLFGRSKSPMDFVKIQNYSFLRTEKEGFHQIGRPFYMFQGNARISLYVAMCKTCKMIFMMAGIEVAAVESAERGYWRHVVIDVTDSVSNFQQLYVFLFGNDTANKGNNFWAIDYVKVPLSGTRSIKIKGYYSCGSLFPEEPTESKIYNASLKTDISTKLKWFKITHVDEKEVSFMYQNTLGDEEDIKIIAIFANIGGPSRGHVTKPKKCYLRPDFSCASINLPEVSNSTLGTKEIKCNLHFLQDDTEVGSVKFSLPYLSYNKYEIAHAPEILDYRASLLLNDLRIKWSHPYVDGVNLRSFKIELIRASPNQESINRSFVYFKIVNPSAIYSLILANFPFESCADYFLQIRPINSFGLGFAATNLVLTPPRIPSINIKKEERNASIHFSIEPVEHECRKRLKGFRHSIYILLSGKENQTISTELKELEKLLDRTVPRIYRAIKTIIINGSETNIDFQFTPVENEIKEHLVFVEVITSPSIVKYFKHKFDLEGTSGRLGEKNIQLSSTAFLVGILVSLLICCCIIIRIFKKKKELLNIFRRRTFGNIYFSGDRIKLINESFSNTTNRIEKTLRSTHEINLGSNKEIPEETLASRPVRITDFEKYVKMSITNDDLSRQFESLPVDLTKPCENGQLECNKPKNRFQKILPYDDSRIKLAILKNKEGSDYINANYIKGHKRSKSFIAAQGPKSLTINDFWRMVWQENVRNIIMLVNLEESGVKKVEKYWPSYNEDFQFGKIHVFYHSFETFADYEIRVFRLVCDGSERKVLQYHYQNWPDNGVPIVFQSLVGFIRKTMEIHLKTPILVHCCSGTSATGVYILCHICLQMAREIGAVDVFKIAKQLRDQRVNMIHDVLQYKLAHLLILEYLVGLQAVIACHEDIEALVETLTDPEKLRLQMMYLEDLSWQYRALVEFPEYEHIFTVCPEKNRVEDIVPDVIGAIQLKKYPDMDESSSYINAIKVDRYQCSQKYIVTQQPMPNTLNDFWRMVIQQDVEVIVSLNDIDLKDKTSCIIWPTAGNPKISPVDFITIDHSDTVDREIYEVIEVHVLTRGKTEKTKPVKVTIVSYKGWKPKTKLPENMQNFLKFCGFVDSITRQLEHTVVTCYDGCLASGVYVATSYLIEMIKNQKCFDVCNTVRVIRRNRKQFITEEMQLAFLYEVSATYIKGYENYANFAAGHQKCDNVYDYIQ